MANRKPASLLVALALLFALSAVAAAQVPQLLSYQGRLTAANGAPLPDGQYNLTFRLFGQLSGGTQTWFQEMNPVVVRNGVFAVLLGSGAPLTEAMFTGTTFLEVQVGDAAPLTPRQPIVSVAYALKAERATLADTVPSGSIGTAVLADGAVTTPKLADGAVATAKMVDAAVTGPKIADGSVVAANLGADPGSLIKVSGGVLRNNASRLEMQQSSYIGTATTSRSSHNGQQLGWYSLGWYSDTWNTEFDTCWLSGCGGIKMFTNEAMRLSIDVWGNVDIPGNLRVRGTDKNRVVATRTYGDRAMYAFESTENRFLDQGVAKLVDGRATIELDPMFAETIEGELLVHLTPRGPAALYVEKQSATTFTVRALNGDPAVSFVWQVSAASKGQRGVRMAPVPKVGDR